MTHRAKPVVALAAAGAAMGVVAALLLWAAVSARTESTAAVHGHGHAMASAADPAASGFQSEMAAVTARMHDAMAVAPSGDVDRDFIRMMIPHHQGAIDMARVLLTHGHDERLKRLAQSIIVEQGQEIAYMRTLLAAPLPATCAAQSRPDH